MLWDRRPGISCRPGLRGCTCGRRPLGRDLHLLWLYNYSTCCPRDAAGHTCAEVLADELAANFAPSGGLATFDGLEFDELNGELPRLFRQRIRSPDYDADVGNGPRSRKF